jgi:phosphonate transport system permease protein
MAEVRPQALFEAEGRQNLLRFVTGMVPPELSWSFLALMARPVVETIQISILGTALAVFIGFPLGLVATGSLTWSGVLHEMVLSRPHRILAFGLYALARALLNLMRSIPELIWAFMFVRAVGLGPFSGVLAIGVSYGGILGKVYSEILESVNPRPLEALQATGASKPTVVLYGLLPQAFSDLTAYTLYRWECAIRASAILGFVGAGGIGQQIEISMRMFNFHEVLTLIGILAILVGGVDAISARVRRAVL